MTYTFVLHPKCRKEINIASKKNPVLKKVLEIDETRKTVIFLAFSHHDRAYKR